MRGLKGAPSHGNSVGKFHSYEKRLDSFEFLVVLCVMDGWHDGAPAMDLRVFGNKFKLIRRIGSGSFGDIYLGTFKVAFTYSHLVSHAHGSDFKQERT